MRPDSVTSLVLHKKTYQCPDPCTYSVRGIIGRFFSPATNSHRLIAERGPREYVSLGERNFEVVPGFFAIDERNPQFCRFLAFQGVLA